MKPKYTFLFALLLSITTNAQNYEFGIVHISSYDFKIVAIPDFDSSGNTDISDVGFTLVMPAGLADIVNASSLMASRVWNIEEYDAAFLTNLGIGDGTKDVTQFNMPPGQTILQHTSGEQIDLVSFQVNNTPAVGNISFLLNNDPIALASSNVLDSFYNTDLDGPGNNPTADFFGGIAPGMESFMFSVLSIDEVVLNEEHFVVYPNPTKGFISISGLTNADTIDVFNILGTKVKTVKNTTTIDLSNEASGVYLLKIALGKVNKTQKIIVE